MRNLTPRPLSCCAPPACEPCCPASTSSGQSGSTGVPLARDPCTALWKSARRWAGEGRPEYWARMLGQHTGLECWARILGQNTGLEYWAGDGRVEYWGSACNQLSSLSLMQMQITGLDMGCFWLVLLLGNYLCIVLLLGNYPPPVECLVSPPKVSIRPELPPLPGSSRRSSRNSLCRQVRTMVEGSQLMSPW